MKGTSSNGVHEIINNQRAEIDRLKDEKNKVDLLLESMYQKVQH